MNPATLLLIIRLLFAKTTEKTISTMSVICFIGIFVGSFSLTLVTSIMDGFQRETYKKFQGIHADIIISSENAPINSQAVGQYFQTKPEIIAWAPSTTRYGLISSEDFEGMPVVVMIKAVDPIKEHLVSNIDTKIEGNQSLQQLLQEDSIIIGKKLAERISVLPNSMVQFMYSDNIMQKRKPKFSSRDLVVSGIFSVGIDEFDANTIICSYALFDTLFPSAGVEQINIKLAPETPKEPIIKELQTTLNLQTYSWESMYLPLVIALEIEKYVSFFVLALITLVASMNIVSLLFMQITEKRPDIAILKAIGMSNKTITTIFIGISVLQSSFAAIVGIMSAFICGLFLQKYPIIKLPEIYFMSHLPISLDWTIFIVVFVTVLCISFLATLLPVYSIKHIHISKVLRHES